MDTPTPPSPAPPVVFISYSWTNDEHVGWVTNLARRLRANGVDVHLDRWDVPSGGDLYVFMERYADPSARVLVVLSDDYAPKADKRGEVSSGVGTETTIVSPTVYERLGDSRVIPIVPDSGTVAAKPVTPIYLRGRNWIDFRSDHEQAYEDLLRELHGAPVEVAPPLGVNPFIDVTAEQARASIRNDPARWSDSRSKGIAEINLNENSGRYTLGAGDVSFNLSMDHYSGWSGPGAPKRVRHYADYIGKIGLVTAAADHPQRFDDLSIIPMSNRVEVTSPGDALVALNRNGYWMLLLHQDVTFREGPNGFEAIAVLCWAIATDRSAALTLADLPTLGA